MMGYHPSPPAAIPCGTIAILTMLGLSQGKAVECERGGNADVLTDHFFFTASADQGSPGDVVGIDFSLTLDDPALSLEGLDISLFAFNLVGCYEGDVLELIEKPRYSEYFYELIPISHFFMFPGDEEEAQGEFTLFGNIRRDVAAQSLLPGVPFPLVTLYFRIRGQPLTDTPILLCDNVLVSRSCSSNSLDYITAIPTTRSFITHSTRHVDGLVRIVPGEPTRPDPPPLPENAKVYPEAPTPETAEIHFELEGPPVTHPGALEVPLRLYVTSKHEFSGFMTSLIFPPDQVEIARVEEHTRPGVVQVDNAGGGFGIITASSRQRIGREGERVHLATLYANVKEAAGSAAEVEIAFEPFGNFKNWLAIHHREGQTGILPSTSEVSPLHISNALLRVEAEPTRPGDVNIDHVLDLSDPIHLLAGLFQGEEILCPEAADFNEDSTVDLADPISILSALFRGGPAPALREIRCGSGSR